LKFQFISVFNDIIYLTTIVEIPDQVISLTGLSSKEILLKVALMFFQEEKLTL
jgi:predicted HTH domain antitoxin